MTTRSRTCSFIQSSSSRTFPANVRWLNPMFESAKVGKAAIQNVLETTTAEDQTRQPASNVLQSWPSESGAVVSARERTGTSVLIDLIVLSKKEILSLRIREDLHAAIKCSSSMPSFSHGQPANIHLGAASTLMKTPTNQSTRFISTPPEPRRLQ